MPHKLKFPGKIACLMVKLAEYWNLRSVTPNNCELACSDIVAFQLTFDMQNIENSRFLIYNFEILGLGWGTILRISRFCNQNI